MTITNPTSDAANNTSETSNKLHKYKRNRKIEKKTDNWLQRIYIVAVTSSPVVVTVEEIL